MINWIKISEQLPPRNGTEIIIAVRNKNKEDGIWLYDVCYYNGGDITDNNNWEGKMNWEIPICWSYINKPEL